MWRKACHLHANTDTYTDTYTDAHAGAKTNGDADLYASANSHPHAGSNRHACADADADADSSAGRSYTYVSNLYRPRTVIRGSIYLQRLFRHGHNHGVGWYDHVWQLRRYQRMDRNGRGWHF